MSKIILPAIINPPSIRKDGSASIRFDTRELSGEEYITILGYRNTEGFLVYSPNDITAQELSEIPHDAEVNTKSHSQRLRSVMFILFKQAEKKGYSGTFEAYYGERMEAILQKLKDQIDE